MLELAFPRRAILPPESTVGGALFVVVSGGGWVQVGDERVPIHHGEAVVWPAGVPHGAWTDGSEMRAIVIELTDRGVSAHDPLRLVEGESVPVDHPGAASSSARVTAARGRLVEREPTRTDHDETEGEPW